MFLHIEHFKGEEEKEEKEVKSTTRLEHNILKVNKSKHKTTAKISQIIEEKSCLEFSWLALA